MYISNCCGAELYPHTDICTDCKEHCEAISDLADMTFEEQIVQIHKELENE